MQVNFVAKRKVWYAISGTAVLLACLAVAIWRLNIGIDFTGGTLIELAYAGEVPAPAELRQAFGDLGATRVIVQTAGEHGAIVRTAPMDEALRQAVAAAVTPAASIERYELIGPTVGRELVRRTAIGIALSLVLIVVYVAWVFRKAGHGVSSWAYGIVALIAMAHDVIIPVGIFAVLGAFGGAEIGAPFIAAALTILGYSINDTIIVLDRVRENLASAHGAAFAGVVNASVNETVARSINTTLTTILALLAVFLFGGTTLKPFALALMIGIGVGAYSSLFIAAPLLVTWHDRKRS